MVATCAVVATRRGRRHPVRGRGRTVSIRSGNPFGSFDAAGQFGPNAVRLSGWTLDPDTANPIAVHVYVDGRWGGAFTANTSRPDVGRVYPGYGDNHGFDVLVGSLGGGWRNVCVYAINAGSGNANPLLGCQWVLT
jgi:hypothetical protein